MPPRIRITREDIVDAAVRLVRLDGEQAINARSLAGALNCSTQPIFSNFATMDELRAAVRDAADACYQQYLAREMSAGRYPPYKASGMGYIRFAREERALFRLLFMRDRSAETIAEDRESIRPLLDIIRQTLGVTEDEAFLFHMEMWVFVHGVATMIATAYLDWDDALVSDILTDAYEGLKQRYQEGKQHVRHPD